MSHKKAGGSSRNLKDSNPQYLGVKLSDGQKAQPGSIIIRQKGLKTIAGENVKTGKDYTLYSSVDGVVKFSEKRKLAFNGKVKRHKVANVVISK